MPVIDVFNTNKEKVGEVDLDDAIFGVEVFPPVLHEVVTWPRACRRAGAASTKTRAEVAGGGRKPWRQKGTGRARVGSNRSPIWRGGGVIFGPRPRSYAYTLPKKVRRLALKMALSSKLMNGQLVVLEGYPLCAPKTKDFVKVLKTFEMAKVLIVTHEENRALTLSARNVSGPTGKPTTGLYNADDMEQWTECMARNIWAAGVRKGDIIQNAYGHGLFTGGLGFHQGACRIGCVVVPTSSGMTERQIMLMKDFGATALFCTPSYALTIAERAEELDAD